MRYDTKQDYQAPPRYEPPSWQDAEPARSAAPSDLDAATPAPAESTEELGKLWPDDAVHDFQQRWRDVQLRFVDDPRAAADEAQQLVAEALDKFTAALATRRTELDSWREADGADTERMLTVVRRYRKLLDRLLEV